MPVTSSIKDSALCSQIKSAIQSIEPDADIILYGSRARGNAEIDSDWDLLVLLQGVVTESRQDAVYRQIYEVEWETGEVLCAMICSREEWNQPIIKVSPFYKNVVREGIPL